MKKIVIACLLLSLSNIKGMDEASEEIWQDILRATYSYSRCILRDKLPLLTHNKLHKLHSILISLQLSHEYVDPMLDDVEESIVKKLTTEKSIVEQSIPAVQDSEADDPWKILLLSIRIGRIQRVRKYITPDLVKQKERDPKTTESLREALVDAEELDPHVPSPIREAIREILIKNGAQQLDRQATRKEVIREMREEVIKNPLIKKAAQ